MNNFTTLFAVVIVLGLVTLAIKARRLPKSPTAALVKRRRELLAELRRVVPDELEAERIVQAEALRLATSRLSPETLEAAIERAKKDGKRKGEESRYGTV